MSGLHLVEAFLEMMSAERGAARNTIEAYRRDLSDYAHFLASRSQSPQSALREDVVAYLASLDAQGLAPADHHLAVDQPLVNPIQDDRHAAGAR